MNPMEKYSQVATHAGAYSAVYGGLSANEIAAYGGLVIGVVGLIINWYYKAKEDKRAEKAAHDRRCTDRRQDADSEQG